MSEQEPMSEDRLKHLEYVGLEWRDSDELPEACREIRRLKAMLFEPLGDNHHNAAMCPYCNPKLEEQTARIAALEKQRDVLQAANTAEVELRRRAEENGFFFLRLIKRHVKECPAFDDQARDALRESDEDEKGLDS